MMTSSTNNSTFAADNNNRNISDTATTPKVGGYQRIEDWHGENHDPKHVLNQLKQEKARWKSVFDDKYSGGDGI